MSATTRHCDKCGGLEADLNVHPEIVVESRIADAKYGRRYDLALAHSDSAGYWLVLSYYRWRAKGGKSYVVKNYIKGLIAILFFLAAATPVLAQVLEPCDQCWSGVIDMCERCQQLEDWDHENG